MRPDGCRDITKAFRRKSQVFQSMSIACVINLFLCRARLAALGSNHPRCELIFFNQTFRKTVDQSLQRVLARAMIFVPLQRLVDRPQGPLFCSHEGGVD
jgi:hypothetical protein